MLCVSTVHKPTVVTRFPHPVEDAEVFGFVHWMSGRLEALFDPVSFEEILVLGINVAVLHNAAPPVDLSHVTVDSDICGPVIFRGVSLGTVNGCNLLSACNTAARITWNLVYRQF